MANNFNLVLDTTAPANPTLTIEGGAVYANQQLVNVAIGTSDGDTTNYQMKIWGDVNTSYNANIQTTEGASTWITYSPTIQVSLSLGDSTKNLYGKVRDDVYNESGQATDSIVLDTTAPIVDITSQDPVNRISRVTGKDIYNFTFQADTDFAEYTVRVVSATTSAHDTGVQIPTSAGSTNMSGTAGNYTASTVINCSIHGTDLQTASGGDGTKIIKVFVRDALNQWSV